MLKKLMLAGVLTFTVSLFASMGQREQAPQPKVPIGHLSAYPVQTVQTQGSPASSSAAEPAQSR